MKIKTDFVTNSSSSSFLVVFKEFPTSVMSLKEQVFGERKEFPNPFADSWALSLSREITEYWDTKMVAEYIFDRTRLATTEEIEEFWKYFDEDDFGRRDPSEFEGKPCAIYNFSDNDGELETSLEHGDVFRRLENYRDSQH